MIKEQSIDGYPFELLNELGLIRYLPEILDTDYTSGVAVEPRGDGYSYKDYCDILDNIAESGDNEWQLYFDLADEDMVAEEHEALYEYRRQFYELCEEMNIY